MVRKTYRYRLPRPEAGPGAVWAATSDVPPEERHHNSWGEVAGYEPLSSTDPGLAAELVEIFLAEFAIGTRASRRGGRSARSRSDVCEDGDGEVMLRVHAPFGGGAPAYGYDGTHASARTVAKDLARYSRNNIDDDIF
ncbi:MAG: hypothetical protein V9E84_06485 [Trichococcus flocculiformis]